MSDYLLAAVLGAGVAVFAAHYLPTQIIDPTYTGMLILTLVIRFTPK